MSDEQPQAGTLWIIWGAMVTSIIIYGVVGVVAAPPITGDEDPMVPVAIAATALGPGILSLLTARIMPVPVFQTHCILRWAFAESVGIMGLVSHFVGGPLALMVVLQAWSLFLLSLAIPTRSRYDAWAAKR